MSNAVKNIVSVAAALGLIYSMFAGACVGAADSFAENSDISKIKAVSAEKNQSYSEYRAANFEFEPASASINLKGGDYSAENGSGAERLEAYNGKSRVLKWDSERGSVTYDFSLPEDGLYNITLTYIQLICHGNSIRLSLKIDGAYPFKDAEDITLPRLWTNKGGIRTDDKGDQISPEQTELLEYTAQSLRDSDGVAVLPFEFALRAGHHTVTLEMKEEAFILAEIKLCPPEKTEDYRTVSAGYSEFDRYSGDPVIIQGEDAAVKTSNSLIPKSDNSPHLTPASPRNLVINYIGSGNWSTPGQVLTWKFNAPKTGLYKLGFKYKQSQLVNGISYRYLKIDGKTPFTEARAIAFPYKTGWQISEYADNGEAYLFYLTEGPHELSLDVTMADTAELYSRLKDIVTAIGNLYIQINMITGENPDANRNYDLFKQIPGFNDTLKELYEALNTLSEDMKKQSGKRSSSIIAAVENMSRVLKSMYDNPYTSQAYKSDYYTNYSSLSSWLYEMKSMPLNIDEILLTAPDYDIKNEKIGFFKAVGFSFMRFIYSFLLDYEDISPSGDSKTIKVWANIGRDQAQIIQTLIRDRFTPESGIKVNFQAVNATVVKGVISGNPPDIELRMARTEPVNLAMRGVLYDISKFDDFDKVVKRFQPTATLPYEYEGGCYALPDTQSFYLMYYRTDIFEQLGLSVPATWEEFINCAITVQRNKMQVWLPYTQITAAATVNTGIGGLSIFPTLMAQNRLSLYNSELNACSLNTPEAISVFNQWTDFYTEYKIPKEASFYNRFRVGTMPLGIEIYTLYQTLASAAPEIKDRWKIAPLPGVAEDDGSICNLSTGAGTADVIIAGTGKEKQAWEFLKWWTSKEIQLSFSENLESVLGAVGRVETANVEALSGMSWSTSDRNIILSQWNNVEEVREIPGSYYLTRALDQAFWNVTNGASTSKDALLEWSMVADNEIKRKIAEYSSEED